MANYRGVTRANLRAALAQPETGFNAVLASVADSYGATAHLFVLDLSEDSDNVIESYVSGDDIELTQAMTFPCCAIYTSSAKNDPRLEKTRSFCGYVTAHIDLYLEYRYRKDETSGMEIKKTENVADAVEDAITSALTSFTGWSPGVSYSGDFSCEREPLLPLSDGWQQRIAVMVLLEVHV